ncbi:MAG: fluoride exporter [Actinomycetota bacterium]|nr:fluoride exporter [Actinomycetota bacterium]
MGAGSPHDHRGTPPACLRVPAALRPPAPSGRACTTALGSPRSRYACAVELIDPDVGATRWQRVTRRRAARPPARELLAARSDILLVAAGGALGSLGRWALGQALAGDRGSFPRATFIENLSGAFALGVLMVLVLDLWPTSRYIRPFLGVGVLGGYTTFSTYLLDARTLFAADRPLLSAVYLVGTLAGGLVATWAGMFLTGRVTRRGGGRRR